MAFTEAQREHALKLVQKLIEIADGDEGMMLRAMQIRDRLNCPMAMVLDKVPGDSVLEKAKRIGVTRQAYYGWLKGEYRPNRTQSRKLARLTGLDIDDIHGRAH